MPRIALLSNVTVGMLAGMLEKQGEVYVSDGYDTWQQDIFNKTSGLYEAKPDAAVILLHGEDYLESFRSAEAGGKLLDQWRLAVSTFACAMPETPIFAASLDIRSSRCRYGSEINLDKYFENRWIEAVQKLHQEGKRVYLLPVKELIEETGRQSFYSSKMWYMGSMPYSMKGMKALAELIGKYVSAARGGKKKCLAVDLDNTLWGGVIGEDGLEGLVLSGHKEGARYQDTQRILKKMQSQGVMLAILSKNNVEDVEGVFGHPDMVLREEDFAAKAINWKPKTENIRAMADTLNIGLDAFVFLDDNPAEREQMKAECPEVAVIDFPRDTSKLPETVEKAYEEYFLTLEVTGEDRQKTAMYRSEAKRKAERENTASVEDYLRNLEMRMDIHLMTEVEEERVVQLVNKTNQFNLTTVRYSGKEIRQISEEDESSIITVHMSDKYGEQGLVAVVILKEEGKTARIDTFLMSCRVMGRRAEDAIAASLGGWLAKKGIERVTASYIRTAKNRPVETLYERLGFELEGTEGVKEESGYRKDYCILVNELPKPPEVFCSIQEFEGNKEKEE